MVVCDSVDALCEAMVGGKEEDVIAWELPFGDAGATRIAEVLQENRSVKKLVLYSCNIEKAGATALAHALRGNSELRSFDYTSNPIGVEGSREIAAVWNKTRTSGSGHHVSSGGKWHDHEPTIFHATAGEVRQKSLQKAENTMAGKTQVLLGV
ncbi:hypothetical protein T484DRAFT_1956977 [Baffinella frigidus]|nr:hypothetical protein T484DRAFT_1956977 [Cryptophyta sp. CCMP2293]